MTRGKGSDFWSRRKAAVREAELREEAQIEEQQTAEQVASLEEMTDEEICEKLELPNPDELDAKADFKPFLQAFVPERLRRRALRRLWTLNPVLANVDGLVEYGEDFTDSATVVEGLQTTYQVGKGMLKHIEKLAEDAEKERQAANSDDRVDEASEDEVAEVEPDDSDTPDELEPAEDDPISDRLTENETFMHTEGSDSPDGDGSEAREIEPFAIDPETESVSRRRMRFSFS